MSNRNLATVGLACGFLAVLAAAFVYWIVPVPIVLGMIAIALGIRGRQKGDSAVRELAVAAVALGLAGIVATGGSLLAAHGGEDFGRHCAAHPADSDC